MDKKVGVVLGSDGAQPAKLPFFPPPGQLGQLPFVPPPGLWDKPWKCIR
ncbi:hypothetical protein [Rhodococcus sp. NCIMB 12038]|nr:hypothetical protein [Rhodococcus sp. NCIMB 12038]